MPMRILALSRSVIYEQIRSGRLKSVTQGRTLLIPAAAIADYVALLLCESDNGAALVRTASRHAVLITGVAHPWHTSTKNGG